MLAIQLWLESVVLVAVTRANVRVRTGLNPGLNNQGLQTLSKEERSTTEEPELAITELMGYMSTKLDQEDPSPSII